MKRLSFVVALLCLGSLPAISATLNKLTLSDALQHALRSNPELQRYDNNASTLRRLRKILSKQSTNTNAYRYWRK